MLPALENLVLGDIGFCDLHNLCGRSPVPHTSSISSLCMDDYWRFDSDFTIEMIKNIKALKSFRMRLLTQKFKPYQQMLLENHA
jgi:hypothetical protein